MSFDKLKYFLFVLCLFVFISGSQSRGVNGGFSCAVCTVVTGLIQQTAYLRGVTFFNAARTYCKQLPIKAQETCFTVIDKLEPFLADKRVLNLLTPDVFCFGVRACRIDPGQQFCHLFPKPHLSIDKTTEIMTELVEIYNLQDTFPNFRKTQQVAETNEVSYDPASIFFRLMGWNFSTVMRKMKSPEVAQEEPLAGIDFCGMPYFKEICDILSGDFSILTPAVDVDGDGFSIVGTARGFNWRGKDCDELDSAVYPGAQTPNLDASRDANCNGIWGEDGVSGRPWEDVLCGDSQPRGILYLGDSLGAHFHMPERWMDPNKHDQSSVSTIMQIILNELDWPELGFATGYMNTTHPELIKGVTDSLYLRLRDRDRCNHRDYQNSAKNGAMSRDGFHQVNAISRKPSDKPVLLIYAMIGNDVCNSFPDTVASMTTPQQFEDNVLEVLHNLDEKLPRNSEVVLVSLLDASFIYPEMADRIHPLGSVQNNIRYKDLYSWFSCMQIGPCEGWMTGNETLRNITTQKAAELSAVLRKISIERKFVSFRLHFLKNPLNTALQEWIDKGGDLHTLIDPVDSIHPNQLAQPLMADAMWKSLEELGVLGPENPHNQKIIDLFGEQGGH